MLHGSSDKKRCRSNPQTPSFSTLSEYAPPSNPGADHLVAANPFDDNYNAPSFKPLSTGSPYFSPSQYPGQGGYGPPRAPHLLPGRMASPYGGPHPQRSQLHPFLQNQAGFNHPPGFTYGHQENPSFRSQSMLGTRNSNLPLPANQLVRPGMGDTMTHPPQRHVGQTPPPEQTGPGSRPEAHPSGDPPHRTSTDSSPGCVLQESGFSPSSTTTPKPDPGDAARGRASPRRPSQASSEGGGRAAEGRSRGRGHAAGQEGGQTSSADKLNGTILPSEPANPGNPSDPGNKALKKSPQAARTVEPAPPERSRVGCRAKGGGGGGGGGVASNKTGMHPCRSSLSSEPMYPCGICLSEVKDNQEAILCEALCQKWFHRVCTGMTETAYSLLTAEAWAVWGCDACMEDKGAPLLTTKEPTEPSVSTDG